MVYRICFLNESIKFEYLFICSKKYTLNVDTLQSFEVNKIVLLTSHLYTYFILGINKKCISTCDVKMQKQDTIHVTWMIRGGMGDM